MSAEAVFALQDPLATYAKAVNLQPVLALHILALQNAVEATTPTGDSK